MLDEIEHWHLATIEVRFSIPSTPALRELYAHEWGRTDPANLRRLSRDMDDLPDRRRVWLMDVADRMDVAGYASFDEVPVNRFDEIVQRY